MIVSIAIIVLVAVVAYFHYIQGLFSAGLSAIIAIFAGALAVGWHESLADLFVGDTNKVFAGHAYAITLIALFAIIYLVLRIAFDMLIPGNVQFPFLLDKIGAPVMGVIAGLAGIGVCAVAAESLPFGPTYAGYSRYEFKKEESVVLPQANAQAIERKIRPLAMRDFWTDSNVQKPIIPAADFVVGLTSKLSSGSLSRFSKGNPDTYPLCFSSVHPNYLRELFGQRLGIEVGTRRDTIKGQMSVAKGGVMRLPPRFEVADNEGQLARKDEKRLKLDDFKEGWESDQRQPVYVVVRAKFGKDAADEDGFTFRFSTGAVRLVTGSRETPNGRDYFPIGTMDGDRVMLSAPDDPLFIDLAGMAADLVFQIDPDDLVKGEEGTPNSQKVKLPPNTFLEIKRFARADLSGSQLVAYSADKASNGVLRHKPIGAPTTAPSPTHNPPDTNNTTTTPPVANNTGFRFPEAAVGPYQFRRIATNTPDRDALVNVPGGSISLRDGLLQTADLDGSATGKELETGTHHVKALRAPSDKRIVSVTVVADKGDWDWLGSVDQFEITAGGQKIKPWGLRVTMHPGSEIGRVYFKYDMDMQIQPQSLRPGPGKPWSISLIYFVPPGAKVELISYKGQPIAPLNVQVP